MLNNISNSAPPTLNTPPHLQQPFSNSHQKIVNYINQAYNQPLSLEKIPIEIIQKIAFKLELDSYANLRLTSSKMSNNLPSIETMISSLKNICSGELKKNYASMYQKVIIDQLDNKTNNVSLQTMKHIFAGAEELLVLGNGDTIILCKNGDAVKNELGDTLLSCIIKVIKKAPRHTPPINSMTDTHYAREIVKTIEFHTDSKHINKKNLNIIFKSFNEIFTKDRAENRLMSAISAYKIRNLLKDKTPNGISEYDIIQCASQYPMLFMTGEIAVNHLLTKQ